MLSLAPSIEAKQITTTEVSADSVVINQQKQEHSDDYDSTNHIFKSKLPDIPISNHLPLHTYCFQKLSEISDRPCLIVASTEKHTHMQKLISNVEKLQLVYQN
ncbi:unnamed protein product [Trifolium pratense]|uniref:Uncharacterized protein n=1 Tax=Trifolium pratense TaxID=57577 RepID=A0ACB0K412_TRIPR|nr:unnamed protein product [Trifolium pratense]